MNYDIAAGLLVGVTVAPKDGDTTDLTDCQIRNVNYPMRCEESDVSDVSEKELKGGEWGKRTIVYEYENQDLRPAMANAAKMVLEYYKGKRCDSDAVSGCLKCNSEFIASHMLAMTKLPTDKQP